MTKTHKKLTGIIGKNKEDVRKRFKGHSLSKNWKIDRIAVDRITYNVYLVRRKK